jgi:hypothetical protein
LRPVVGAYHGAEQKDCEPTRGNDHLRAGKHGSLHFRIRTFLRAGGPRWSLDIFRWTRKSRSLKPGGRGTNPPPRPHALGR